MKMWLAALTAVAVIGFVQTSEAASLSAVSRRAVLRDLRSVRADHWAQNIPVMDAFFTAVIFIFFLSARNNP